MLLIQICEVKFTLHSDLVVSELIREKRGWNKIIKVVFNLTSGELQRSDSSTDPDKKPLGSGGVEWPLE